MRIPVAELGKQHDIGIAFQEQLARAFCGLDAVWRE